MSICLNCGTIMHPDDAKNHICNETEVPKKGEKFKPIISKVIE